MNHNPLTSIVADLFLSYNQRLEGIETLLNDIKSNQKASKKETLRYEKLTRKEVCQRYKISLGTLHKFMRTGEIPFAKIGKRTLFDESQVERFFESNKKELL